LYAQTEKKAGAALITMPPNGKALKSSQLDIYVWICNTRRKLSPNVSFKSTELQTFQSMRPFIPSSIVPSEDVLKWLTNWSRSSVAASEEVYICGHTTLETSMHQPTA
jgi:hypothetical protein